jgi:hypothetical protein
LEERKSTSYNLFLMGAGFTKAVFPKAPLNENLLLVLCQGAPCTTLKKYHREYKTKDIEILLTRLDLDIFHSKARQQIALRQVRNAIEQQLAEYFRQFRFNEDVIKQKSWLESFVHLFRENDIIITTNYDCFLDGLMDYYGMWTPNGGYPKLSCRSLSCPKNPKNILIYKIHGSENFRESPKATPTGNAENTTIGFTFNESIYPTSGKSADLDYGIPDHTGPCIIAPSFIKSPHHHIEHIMIDALQLASKAKNMIVIGSGLRVEDSFLWLLLSAFIEPCIPDSRKKKLVIVDPKKAEEIIDRITKHCMWDIDEILLEKPKPIKKDLGCAIDDLTKELN